MPSDTAQIEDYRDPRNGTAVIPPVTDAMMDHAAHEASALAAALADGVAHGTLAIDAQTPGAPDAVGDATPLPDGGPVPDIVERVAAAAADGVHDAVATTADGVHDTIAAVGAAAGEAQDATAPFTPEAADGPERGGDPAPDRSLDPADALARYNAKLFEMMRVNVASTTALFASLTQAKSVPEALALNADHLRRQVETLTGQGRELATLAQRIALDALQPFKG